MYLDGDGALKKEDLQGTEMNNYLKYIIVFVCLLFGCHDTRENSQTQTSTIQNHKGCVTDEITAKKIAEENWLPVYGKSVLNEKPYVAKIVGDSVWVVEGSLPKDMLGGTAYIEIRVRDCDILKLTHYK